MIIAVFDQPLSCRLIVHAISRGKLTEAIDDALYMNSFIMSVFLSAIFTGPLPYDTAARISQINKLA